MSKIFDALSKSEGRITEQTLDIVGRSPRGVGSEAKGASPGESSGEPDHGERRPFDNRNSQGVADDPRSKRQSRDHEPELVRGGPDGAQPREGLPYSPPNGEGLADECPDEPRTPFEEAGRPEETERAVAIRLQGGSPLLPFDRGENSVVAEEYRLIRTKLQQHSLQPRLMLVSSAQASDGKSVTAINLAGAIALNEEAQVLLVEADLRRPSIAGMLGVPSTPGVMEVLAGSCSLEEAVVQLQPFRNLHFLPAGRGMGNPTELFSSPRWKVLCGEMRERMTYVLFDGPPVNAVADYRLLEEVVDGVVVIVRTGHTKRFLLSAALNVIPKEKLLGAVVNGHRDSFLWKRDIGYQYYGYSSKEGKDVSQS